MKSGAIHHPKLRKLKRLLNVPLYAATGILEALWQFAAEYAVDGDLTRFSAEDIAEWVEWEGPPDLLLSSLVGARWLEQDSEGIRIHDWEDHCPDFVKKRITRRKTKDLQHETADNGGQRRTTADNGADVCLPPPPPPPIPNPTQPNPAGAQPNSSEPSPDGEAAELMDAVEPMTGYVFPCNGKGGDSWHLPVSLVDVFKASYPAVNVDREIMAALAWCHANPTQRKTPKGMPRFLNSWLERNQNKGSGTTRGDPVLIPRRTQINNRSAEQFLAMDLPEIRSE